MNNEPAVPRPSPALADLFIPERAAEIAFWTALSMDYGRLVVNWHCGTGELALGLAKNKLRVLGIDPDLEAVEVARAREMELVRQVGEVAGQELMLTWMCHEPRLVALPGPADFGMISGDVLGTYLDDDHRMGLLTNIFQHLRPGGALGLVIPLAPINGTINTTSISGPLRRLPKGIFARRVSTRQYDPARALLTGRDDVMVRLPDGEQRFQETYERHLYTPDEIFKLLHRLGFISIGMWGGWDRCPLKRANGWFIARAERPVRRAVGRAHDFSG